MTTPLELLERRLKDNNYSITEPRLEIFAALQAQDAQTMLQLVNRCPMVDRATIYRTIELFEKLAIIRKIQIGWKYQLELTDDFAHHHHHFSCTGCGVISAIAEDAELEARLVALALAASFEASEHQIEIHGLCSHCREATATV